METGKAQRDEVTFPAQNSRARIQTQDFGVQSKLVLLSTMLDHRDVSSC